MDSKDKKVVAEAFIKAKAFSDLAEPTIYTSGEIGIYYINTEKLLGDNGKWEEFGDDSLLMINHCYKMYQENANFNAVIDVLAKNVLDAFPEDVPIDKRAIAGGQRRDWLFSGPVARILNLPHISLHKDNSAYLINKENNISSISNDKDALKDMYCVHIVDLITKASSAYNAQENPVTGWIPELRKRGAIINDLFSIVSRMQGGEANLNSASVNPHVFIEIGTEFLKEYSSFPDRAINYFLNPKKWSENYIKENGISVFEPFFSSNSSKKDRAEKFKRKYKEVLDRL